MTSSYPTGQCRVRPTSHGMSTHSHTLLQDHTLLPLMACQAGCIRTACCFASKPGSFLIPSPALASGTWALVSVLPLTSYEPRIGCWNSLSLNFPSCNFIGSWGERRTSMEITCLIMGSRQALVTPYFPAPSKLAPPLL